LFVDGLYFGAYPSEAKALSIGSEIKKRDGINYPIFIPSVHIKEEGVEYKEIINSISKSKIFEIHEDSKIVFARISDSYHLDISLLNDQITTESESFLFDSGASFSHTMYQDYVKADNYRYSEFPFTEDNELILDQEKQKNISF
jgi:hypothetical protein